MIDITFDTRRGNAMLDAAMARVIASVKREMRNIAVDLTAHVKDRRLSGQVLKVRTGRLRRSINFKVAETEGGVSATVGTNVEYGRMHELGFRGAMSVREHMRKNGAKVRAHTRNVNMPARPFLRPSLEAMRPDIDRRMAGVLRGAAQGGAK